MAFGTAEHGTTRGCLRLLSDVVRSGERVLDVGAGSGILSVAAARLGAAHVTAVEADPLSCETLVDNVAANAVAGVVSCVAARADPALLRSLGPADGAVANIDRGALAPLLPGFRDAVRRGGWLVLSGVLDEEWRAFSAEVEAVGFRARSLDSDGEWRAGLFDRVARESPTPRA